eukprot:763990-Hanusia_phi.AAC.2
MNCARLFRYTVQENPTPGHAIRAFADHTRRLTLERKRNPPGRVLRCEDGYARDLNHVEDYVGREVVLRQRLRYEGHAAESDDEREDGRPDPSLHCTQRSL